jgi:hypothetical protein
MNITELLNNEVFSFIVVSIIVLSTAFTMTAINLGGPPSSQDDLNKQP